MIDYYDVNDSIDILYVDLVSPVVKPVASHPGVPSSNIRRRTYFLFLLDFLPKFEMHFVALREVSRSKDQFPMGLGVINNS